MLAGHTLEYAEGLPHFLLLAIDSHIRAGVIGTDATRLTAYKAEQRHYDAMNLAGQLQSGDKWRERHPPPFNAYWPPANWTAEQVKAEMMEAENQRREQVMDQRNAQ